MHASRISPKSARPSDVQREPDSETETRTGRSVRSASDVEAEDLDKSHAAITPRRNQAGGFSPKSFAMPIVASEAQDRAAFNMARINQERSDICRSVSGLTSGVFLITDPEFGTVVGVLKPVKDREIFANRLFKMLEMPIPGFDIANMDDFKSGIRDRVTAETSEMILKDAKMMVMEPVSGRSMSEYCAADLKEFLLEDRNLEFFGKSMALDIFTGNGDRIIPFTKNRVNPDNIMFQDKSIVFIDQTFVPRGTKKEAVFAQLAAAMEAGSGTLHDIDVYRGYVLPLVEKSLQKYNREAMRSENHSPIAVNSFETWRFQVPSATLG